METQEKSTYVNYPRRGRVYEHYKGGYYSIITLAKNTTNDETMVIYKSMEFGSIYARPLSEFFERLPEGTSKTQQFRFQVL